MTETMNPRSTLHWLTGDSIHYLVAFLLLAGCLWAFAEIADEVAEGESQAFDRMILEALREPGDLSDPLGPPWMEEAVRDITALGSVTVLTLIALSVAGFLLLEGKPRTVVFMAVAVVGGLLLSLYLKDLFDRPRPDFLLHGQAVYTRSFPSAHSMNAAVVYLTLASILARAQQSRATRIYVVGFAVVITVLVGSSRLYLGVHWPTDVLAGWTAGAAWAMACYLFIRLLQHRRMVEQAVGVAGFKGEEPLLPGSRGSSGSQDP